MFSPLYPKNTTTKKRTIRRPTMIFLEIIWKKSVLKVLNTVSYVGYV